MPGIDPLQIQDGRNVDPRLADYARRRAMSRDVTDRQRAVEAESQESSFIQDVAKIGILAVGSYFLGKKAAQNDVVMAAVHKLGQGGRKVGAVASEFTRGLLEHAGGTRRAVRGSSTYYDHFELLETYAKAHQIHGQVEAEAGHRIISGNAAHQAEIILQTRRALRDRGFHDIDRSASGRFRPLTVGDVLDSDGLQEQIGESNFKVLQRGYGEGKGALSRDMPLMRRGLGGAYIDKQKRETAGFIDARWLNPKYIARGSLNLLSNIQVPFFGFRPVDLISNLMRPFSEGEFAAMATPNTVIGKTATGKVIRTPKHISFMMGGKLFGQRGPSGGFDVIAEGLRALPKGGVGDARLMRHGGAAEIAPELAAKVAAGSANWWERTQHKLGIGPAFKTQDHALQSLVVAPIMRRDAVLRGRPIKPDKRPWWKKIFSPYDGPREKASVEMHDTAPRRATLSYPEKLRVQQGAHPSQVGKPQDYDVLGEAIPNPSTPLSKKDKIGVYFGRSERASIAWPKRSRMTSNGPVPIPVSARQVRASMLDQMDDVAISARRGLTGRRTATRDEPLYATRFGEMPGITPSLIDTTPTVPINTYLTTGKGPGFFQDPMQWIRGQGEAVVDIANYMTTRLNDLIGMTTGMGFRPTLGMGITGGLGATAGNVAKIYGMQYAAETAVGYLNYADYLFESTFGKLLPEGWDSPKKMAIRAYQGLHLARAYLRDMAGIPDAARYLEDLMPGSINSGLSFVGRTALPGAAGAALGGLPGLAAGLGLSALLGGNDVTDTAEDKLALFRGEKDVAIRKSRWWMLGRQPFEGGQIDHFAPHWTVRELSDYRFTDVQYGSRSEYYENISRLPSFHNFFGLKTLFQDGGPIAGGDKYLAKKHAKTRPYPNSPGVDYEKAVRAAQLLASKGPHDSPFGAGARLGMGTEGGLAPRPRDQEGLLGGIHSLFGQVSELTGVYKFLFNDLPGSESGDAKMASYKTIGSKSREFYDASVGGLFGMTELYRRFVLSQDAKQGINPMPNQMPDWLPGMRSQFKGDQVQPNRFDYTLGDPYAKVAQGEYRLPGAGYEALHRLHSGTPGVYDAMDRFMILADVAPSSNAFKQYRAIVESWSKAGVLDAHWSEKFNVVTEQVSKKMEKYQFAHRRFSGLITDPDPEGTRKRYNTFEKIAGAAWEVGTHDVMPRLGDAVPILGPMVFEKGMQKLSPVEHYLRYQIHGEEFADWRHPYKAFVRPKWNNLINQDPITSSLGGAASLGMIMGSTPIGMAIGATVGAGLFGGGSVAKYFDDNPIPDFRQREFELSQWFDSFEYTKSQMLESSATGMGDKELARYYAKQKRRTITSLDYTQPDAMAFSKKAMGAIGRQNRAYFSSFMDMPSDAQDAVLPYMPQNMRPVLLKATDRLSHPRFSQYRKMTTMSSDQRAASFFMASGGLPSQDWAGWHPDVSMDAVKIKMIDSGVNSVSADIHKFDLFEEHRFRAGAFDNLTVPIGNLENVHADMQAHADLHREMINSGFHDTRFRYAAGPQTGVSWNMVNSKFDTIRGHIAGILR